MSTRTDKTTESTDEGRRAQQIVRRCVDCKYFSSLDETIINGECEKHGYGYISDKYSPAPTWCPLGLSLNIKKDVWRDIKKEKPSDGSMVLITSKDGRQLAAAYFWRGRMDHISPIGFGGSEIECDFYEFGYWIELFVEVPTA